MNTQAPWSVAIIASRENPDVLSRCLDAVLQACGGRPAVVDILVNGNPMLAEAMGKLVQNLSPADATVRVWSIAAGDKANAWNEFVHRIWPANSHAFFIDGDVQVKPEAFAALVERMENSAGALAATARTRPCASTCRFCGSRSISCRPPRKRWSRNGAPAIPRRRARFS